MKLSVGLVMGGRYVRAGDALPADFILPEHLDRFVVYDDPPQASRASLRGPHDMHHEESGRGAGLANPVVEEFVPKPKSTKWSQMRHVQKERKLKK